MSILDAAKNIKVEDTILPELKKNNFMIRDMSLLKDPYIIYKTPKKLYLVEEDWTVHKASFKVWYTYLVFEPAKNKLTLHKDSTYVVRMFNEKYEPDERRTAKISINNKIIYELAQKEKKFKWKKTILVDKKWLVHISYVNKSYNKYQLHFQKKDWTKEIKKAQASNKYQILEIATNIRLNNSNYYKLEFIYRNEFAKTVWEELFIVTKERKPLSSKELLDFTRKLYKIHKAEEKNSISAVQAIEKLIYTSEWNVRSTAIALTAIAKKSSISEPEDLFEAFNKNDIKLNKKPSFDNIYIKIVSLAKRTGSLHQAYYDLIEIIQRRVFLETALKKALIGPTITLFMIILIWLGAVKQFSIILFKIYDWMELERPVATQKIVDFMDFMKNSPYNPEVFANITWWPDTFLYKLTYIFTTNWFLIFLILAVWYAIIKFLATENFTGKKFVQDLFLTIPIFWNFFIKRDFEIFLTVAANLYSNWTTWVNSTALPLLKGVVSNYHIQWVIHTAHRKFIRTGVKPGEVFANYPNYFPDKVALLFKASTPDKTEFETLMNTYKNDNDEFIDTLKAIISKLILLVSWIVVILVVLWTVIPMFNLLDKVG